MQVSPQNPRLCPYDRAARDRLHNIEFRSSDIQRGAMHAILSQQLDLTGTAAQTGQNRTSRDALKSSGHLGPFMPLLPSIGKILLILGTIVAVQIPRLCLCS